MNRRMLMVVNVGVALAACLLGASSQLVSQGQKPDPLDRAKAQVDRAKAEAQE